MNPAYLEDASGLRGGFADRVFAPSDEARRGGSAARGFGARCSGDRGRGRDRGHRRTRSVRRLGAVARKVQPAGGPSRATRSPGRASCCATCTRRRNPPDSSTRPTRPRPGPPSAATSRPMPADRAAFNTARRAAGWKGSAWSWRTARSASSGAAMPSTSTPATFRLPQVTKNTAGYPLRPGMDWVDLFVGSEGTLGVVTEARVRLAPGAQSGARRADLFPGRRCRGECRGGLADFVHAPHAGVLRPAVARNAARPFSGDPGQPPAPPS